MGANSTICAASREIFHLNPPFMVYTALKRALEGLCRNILGNMSFRSAAGFMGVIKWRSACESGIKNGFYGRFAKKGIKFLAEREERAE